MTNKTVYYSPLIPKPASLLILENGKPVRIVSLHGDMTLGREDPNITSDITLTSGIVSRNHGEFIYLEGNYYYKDNCSLNGTFYNGSLLKIKNERGSEAAKLKDGDVLRIDRSDLTKPHSDAVEIIFSTFFSPDETWCRYQLIGKREVMIGRDVSVGIQLSDFMVSRRHAALKRVFGGKWMIKDCDSKNGFAVNQEIVSDRQKLNPFDVIRIANTTLIFTGEEIIYNDVSNNFSASKPFSYESRSVMMNVNIDSVTVPGKTLLKDIHLDIESGDFILILGGSGAGKTTFIRSLLGEHRANGKIMLEGMDLYQNFKMLKHKIGLVPQFATTRDYDTVYHTISDAAFSKLSGEYSRKEIVKRVDEVIEKMNLIPHKDTLIKRLSGGQRKRVEVAIQAIGDQEIFILDEPDSGMDFASRTDLMQNLKSCTDNGGVVAVISHAPDDAAQLFTKVIVLAKSQSDEVGHLAYYGDVKNALTFFGVETLKDIIVEINFEGNGRGRADEFIQKFEQTRGGV